MSPPNIVGFRLEFSTVCGAGVGGNGNGGGPFALGLA